MGGAERLKRKGLVIVFVSGVWEDCSKMDPEGRVVFDSNVESKQIGNTIHTSKQGSLRYIRACAANGWFGNKRGGQIIKCTSKTTRVTHHLENIPLVLP